MTLRTISREEIAVSEDKNGKQSVWKRGSGVELCNLSMPSEEARAECNAWFLKKTKKFFFWGYPVSQLYQKDFFAKLQRSFGSSGFCGIIAPLTMFALKKEESSILIHGRARRDTGGQVNDHMWVEFLHEGEWYVSDCTWFGVDPIPRSIYYLYTLPTTNYFYLEHDAFWRSPTTILLARRFSSKKRSELFAEILHAYSDPLEPIPDIYRQHRMDIIVAKPCYIIESRGQNTIIVCREIVDDIMMYGTILPETRDRVLCMLAAGGRQIAMNNLT